MNSIKVGKLSVPLFGHHPHRAHQIPVHQNCWNKTMRAVSELAKLIDGGTPFSHVEIEVMKVDWEAEAVSAHTVMHVPRFTFVLCGANLRWEVSLRIEGDIKNFLDCSASDLAASLWSGIVSGIRSKQGELQRAAHSLGVITPSPRPWIGSVDIYSLPAK